MEEKHTQGQKVIEFHGVVREFKLEDRVHVQRIFSEGMMEMIYDTSIRGFRHHPESLLLYSAMTIAGFVLTKCWWMIVLLPVLVLCGRYLCSRWVILAYLTEAMRTDMGHMEEVYINSPNSRMWVAVFKDQVVGVVAAVHEGKNSARLKRMSVDRRFRRCGVGKALGRKLLEYAVAQGFSTVVLGTTAYSSAAHNLYQRLGFQCIEVENGHMAPGEPKFPLLGIFYRVYLNHYILKVQNIPVDLCNRQE
ncbi:N-acetylaspartate synthetase-like [Nerophis ophidion]|uniref:N-acetylaspartate synthetase-like n=1 Tax=Nerophis ophidion TaxID=159077 RepID=UPI002AE097BD|nr:N-acetylaspartate synthetase-like [Nerophis ophidion]